jgi:hypothetical protein
LLDTVGWAGCLFGSHPEFGFNLAMDRWDVPRMLAHVAFWQSATLMSRVS